MKSNSFEIIISGVRFHGNWKSMCKFCNVIEVFLKQGDIPDKIIERFHNWKPKENEPREDFEKRTISESIINKSRWEKEYGGLLQELKGASKDMINIGRKVYVYEAPDQEIKSIFDRIGRFLASKFLGSFRGIEETVYKNIMLQMKTYYFNTEYFSISITDNKRELDFQLDVPNVKFEDESRLISEAINAVLSTRISFRNKKSFTVQANIFDKKTRDRMQKTIKDRWK
ncbi:MAG: DUF5828 family protein [Candidatus Undinarchaeales archaeon]